MGNARKYDPKPSSGGVYVIVVVGFLLLFELDLDWGDGGNQLFAAFVIIGTTAVAWLAKRFIDRHGQNIGEAQFTDVSHSNTDRPD
ncbi:hypothetical protein [Aurantiacibacter atlanticus]|uniref:hypothetical protein n=1 Tax=Aurantiacibacter atlanticus TaxID=1648404 RepID=UPI00065F5A9C|nr:hypothetical protein [Aurantiacibacter atlanticus]